MTDQLLSLAREAGAHIGKKTTIERGVEPYIFITESQLTAFAERIRQDERERCAEQVPTNWLHPLLTGPQRVGELPFNGPTVEKLLRAIQSAIRSSGTSGRKSDE
jgi:hypothetical protein